MHRWQIRTSMNSPEDEATARRWRRSVCVFYGLVSLVLLTVWGLQQFASRIFAREPHVAGSPASKSASTASPITDQFHRTD